jgi:dATP/dGTP diphosphohydrolase
MAMRNDVKRVPVDYRYDAINPNFLKWMAKIGAYAAEKYGSWEQYTNARLCGEKSPVNHIYEHLRQFRAGEAYDHFDGDVRWHLAAIAYNACMEFFYVSKWGHEKSPLTIDEES